MLYVQEKDFSRHIDMIAFLSTLREFDFIIWFFPSSNHHDVCGLPIEDRNEGEPVTTYGDGTIPVRTKRMPLCLDFVNKFRTDSKIIQENCDSIVLYEKEQNEWSACSISHERMCLVKNDGLKEILNSNGFLATTEAPNWW
jgi:hypothetical protein